MAFASEPNEELLSEYLLPDPATATILSSQVGFGAGHFYSRRPIAGLTHLGIQGGSLVIAGIGGTKFATGIRNSFESIEVDVPKPTIRDIVLKEETPVVTFTPDTDTMVSGLLLLSSGLGVYFFDKFVDTLTAPSSAKRTALNQVEKGKLKRRLDRREVQNGK